MIVQSKCLAELTELWHGASSDRGRFFWVEALLVSTFGLFWFFRLTESRHVWPLFIIPLMQVRAYAARCTTHVHHMPIRARGGGGDRCASCPLPSPLLPLILRPCPSVLWLADFLHAHFACSRSRVTSPIGQLIVWGGIAGGIFFHEFAHLHLGLLAGLMGAYILGLVLVVYGLYRRPGGPSSKMLVRGLARITMT